MKKKTHQEFVTEIKTKYPTLIISSEYLGNKVKIDVECNICGLIWKSKPNNLLSGHGCPRCSKRYKRSTVEFISEMNMVNPSIEILSEFINTASKIKVSCRKCNHVWHARPNHLLRGAGCPNCKSLRLGDRRRIENSEFLKRIRNKNKNIEVLSEYSGALTKVKCRCAVCNNIWEATPANLQNDHGCPVCSESKGEKKINSYLIEHNICFERQKKFDDLTGVNNGQLSYDFYLPAQNLLIEFQGLQHERPIDFTGNGAEYAERQFSIQKEHDRRKKEYARNNNYELLEIWHYDFNNIEKILDNKNLYTLKGNRGNEDYSV